MKKPILSKKSDEAMIIETAKYPRFTIASNHESDLNKTMKQIETANIAGSTTAVLNNKRSSKKISEVIRQMRYIETAMPVLTNILVAGIPLKGNISNRANGQIKVLSDELIKCTRELADMAKDDKSFVKTPVLAKLKKLLEHAGEIKSSVTYVAEENGCVQCCEVHNFETLTVDETAVNNVNFYTYKSNSSLCIAAAINSSFIPKAFETIKITELDNWLSDHNLKSK